MTDNLYYPEISDHYVSGNLKVQTISLPAFVQQKPQPYLPGSQPGTEAPSRPAFKAPLLMRINRILQVALIALSVVAIGAYSLDVMMSRNLTVNQEQARRLSEQNCELSAKLLKAISFQGIQESVLGHSAKQSKLRVPEEVYVAAEVAPAKCETFKPAKHHLPLMAGY